MEIQSNAICSKLGQIEANAILKELNHSECSFGHTVNKKLVHRAAVSEVFLTDVKSTADDKFYTGAHLPRTHSYYNDVPGKTHYENIALLEVCRQSSIIIAHNFYEVPLNAKFIFNEAKFHIKNNKALSVKATPSFVLTEVDVISKEFRGDNLSGLTYEMRIYVDGCLAATKLMDISWMPVPIWNKVRSKGLKFVENFSEITYSPSPAKLELKSLLGRENTDNLVLHPVEEINNQFTAKLHVNDTHPAMFDHPLDHVPGMLLIEAFRQMSFYSIQKKYGLSHSDVYMKDCDIEFTKFTELKIDSACHLNEISVDEASNEISLLLSTTQNNAITAKCHVRIARK
ncbi:MAG: AfsA-related hotdog domain-containing protein [Marinomonas sp.]